MGLALALSACATQPRAAESRPPPPDDPATDVALTEPLVEAVKRGDLGRFDLTDAALIASGFEHSAALRPARARLEALVAPILEGLDKAADPKDRARRLLLAMHQKGGPLGEYDARATTLREVLDRRRYNCVSSAVLYNILAARLGLAVSAQLLPTHARSLVWLSKTDRRPITVETTSPQGFDPDARLEASILTQVGGRLASEGRQLVPDQGSVVPSLVLVGTIYVNRASILQEAGDLQGAEHLFASGEAFAGTDEMRAVLRDQRAALLSQLGADDVLSEDPTRLERAYRTLRAASALGPREPQIRSAVLQNLRAAAERLIHQRALGKDEKPIFELAREAAASGLEPSERSGLQAFALSEIARLRLDQSNFDGAVEAIELALKEPLGPADARLEKTLATNRVSTLRLAALAAAKQGAYARSLDLAARLERLPKLTEEQKKEIADDVLRIVHLAGNKRIDDSDFKGAAEVYRDGLKRFPSDGTCRHNLIAVLERLALPLVSRGECQAAGEHLDEIQALDPASTFPTKARVRCLMTKAEERLAEDDYAEAVALMRTARKASPKEPALANNLTVALLRWTTSLSSNGSCVHALTLAEEAKTLGVAPGAEIKRALGRCKD